MFQLTTADIEYALVANLLSKQRNLPFAHPEQDQLWWRDCFLRSPAGPGHCKSGSFGWVLAYRNSEIYNQAEIREDMLENADLGTTSDSAIVGHMYAKLGDCDELWSSLDGIFACVIVDEKTGNFCAARDPMGICSFYWGKGSDGSIWFSSELKSLQDNCETFELFPPVCLPPFISHLTSCHV